MFKGLIELTWFDITTVGLTIVAIVLVQILNAIWSTLDDQKNDQEASLTSDNNEVTKSLKINELRSLISSDSTTTSESNTTTTTNGKLQKQQSEQNEKYVCACQNFTKNLECFIFF